MAKKYLDSAGLTRLWNKINSIFVTKEAGKGLSSNDFTTADKNKLDTIEEGANNYTLPVADSSNLGGIKSGGDITIDSAGIVQVNDNSHNHSIDNITNLATRLNSKVDKIAGKGLSTNDYTTTEKEKLSGIASGAEVNIINTIKRNGVTLTPDSSKTVNIEIPTKVSELTNDNKYQTYDDVASSIVDIEYSVATGYFKFTMKDGSVKGFYLPIEKFVKSGNYDANTQELVFEIENGNEIRIDVKALVNATYNGDDTTIELINDNGTYKFKLKDSYKNKIDKAETTDNKTFTISSTSTDNQYPSASTVWKAIKDFAYNVTNFTKASSRTELNSTDTVPTLFGKIAKWLSDLKTVAFTGSYNDLTNKPTIPTVGGGTITIKQKGVSKGSFTVNQSSNTTIELTDDNTTYGIANSSTAGLVKSGTDITVDSSGNVSVNDDSHNHTLLQNYFYKTHTDLNKRPTSINIASNNLSSLRSFISGTSDVAGGLPHAAHIIHHDWDHNNNWATQLALPVYDYNGIYFRCQTDKGWETAVWKKVYSENSKPAVADIIGLSTELTNYMKWSDLKNNTTVGSLGWTSATADKLPISSNTLAYWNGLYGSVATASNLQYFGSAIYMYGVKAFRNTRDNWLRINDENTFTNGIYFGSGLVRTDGNFRVGLESNSAFNVDQNNCTWKGVPIATDNIAACVNNTTSKYWYLMYECTLTTSYKDVGAIFAVAGDHGNYSSGIIDCHIRMGNNTVESTSLRMMTNSGMSKGYRLDPTAFVLAWKKTGTNVSNFRIYARVTAQYYGFTMREIHHGERGQLGGKQNPWKGYTNNVDATGGIATSDGNFVAPSGYTFVTCNSGISSVPTLYDDQGNTITSYYAPKTELSKYLPLAGGKVTGEILMHGVPIQFWVGDNKDLVMYPDEDGFGKIGGADSMFFKGYFRKMRIRNEIELMSGRRPSGDTEDGGYYYESYIRGINGSIEILPSNYLLKLGTAAGSTTVNGYIEFDEISVPAKGSAETYLPIFKIQKKSGVKMKIIMTSQYGGNNGYEEIVLWVANDTSANGVNVLYPNMGGTTNITLDYYIDADRNVTVYNRSTSAYAMRFILILEPLTATTKVTTYSTTATRKTAAELGFTPTNFT